MSILGTGTSSLLQYVITPLQKVKPDQPIRSHADLVNHLHQAAQVEMSTIPMYLYAAYSIETKGHNQWIRASPRPAPSSASCWRRCCTWR